MDLLIRNAKLRKKKGNFGEMSKIKSSSSISSFMPLSSVVRL